MIVRKVCSIGGLMVSAWLSACAGGPQPSGVSPADVSALEAEREKNPTDAALVTRLGIAYYEAANYERAHDVLASALALGRANYAATIYLGLTFEELGMLDSARAAYTSAAALTTSPRQKGEINDRLALLTRKELQQAARQALAQEVRLAQEPPVENTVAVFPFRYVGTKEELRPLERGLTHLVITDLSKVNRLRLLERERVQSLVDEMQLAQSGRVDPMTGARSGRILRAASVVQGSLQDLPQADQLKLDASVVNASSAEVSATGSAEDRLQQLFGLEKQVVTQLLQRLGIALTPAEQRAISERPTADLQAFLAFSRGLEAEDRGDFKTAEAEFGAAVARDPNFRAAADRRNQNAQFSSTTQLSAPELAGLERGIQVGGPVGAGAPGLGSTLRNAVAVTVPSLGSTVITQISTNPPTVRPALPEATGNNDPRTPPGGLSGSIIIIITRP